MRAWTDAQIDLLKTGEFYHGDVALVQRGSATPLAAATTFPYEISWGGVAYDPGEPLLLSIVPPQTAMGTQRDFAAMTFSDGDLTFRNALERDGYVGLSMSFTTIVVPPDGSSLQPFTLMSWSGECVAFQANVTGDQGRVVVVSGAGPIANYRERHVDRLSVDQLRNTPGYENSNAYDILGRVSSIPVGVLDN